MSRVVSSNATTAIALYFYLPPSFRQKIDVLSEKIDKWFDLMFKLHRDASANTQKCLDLIMNLTEISKETLETVMILVKERR